MFDEPEEAPAERSIDPANRAKEKADEFRVHAQLAAVFEAVRKFDVSLQTRLDAQHARDIQRSMAKLEKAKSAESPVLPADFNRTSRHRIELSHRPVPSQPTITTSTAAPAKS